MTEFLFLSHLADRLSRLTYEMENAIGYALYVVIVAAIVAMALAERKKA